MAWKKIPYREWAERADVGFWQPYGRTRSDFSRMQMVRRQLAALQAGDDEEVAKQFAQRLAFDAAGATWVRATCLAYLAALAETEGDVDTAIDYAMLGRSLHDIVDGQQLVQLVIEHQRADRAAETAQMLQDAPVAANGVKETLDLERAAMLMLAGQEVEARELANQAFDAIDRARHSAIPTPFVWASQSRGLNRVLFKLVQRGGLRRIFGLLKANSPLTPDSLAAKMAAHVYFSQADITVFPNRVIVDLSAFSLDFHWSQEPQVIEQVRRRYDSFKEQDRLHIPEPPQHSQQALIMLGIGDDASLPDVVNPLIELSVLLESFDECLFYNRVGPLLRRA